MTTILADVAAAVSRSGELSLLVKVTAALGLGLAVSAMASRTRASVRHLVLAATLASLLALPVAAALAPVVAIEVPVSRISSEPPAAPARMAAVGVPLQTNEFPAAVTAALPWLPSFSTAGRIAWGAGALALLVSLAVSLWRLNRIRKDGVPWLNAPPFILALTAGGRRRRVEVLLHEDVTAPLTCGVLRPVVVLPTDAREWSDEDVRRALVHELEHVQRRDWPVQLAARTVCAAYWFHPLAWIALRKLCLEAERACDDAVVRSGERTEYAAQLVALAQRLKSATQPPVLAMASRSDLSTRVSALLDASARRGRAGLALTLTAVAVAALTVLAIAPVRAVGASGKEGAREAQVQGTGRGDRALFRAAARGDLEQMATLIDAGANVNAALDGDGSPLIAAARQGRLEAAALLLDRGADPNLPVPGDGNPIIMAAREGHTKVVELLLARGANVNQIVDGDENALIQASGSGHLPVVTLLVSKGADVNARVWVESAFERLNGEWRTPLNMAIKGRHEAVVAFLRSAGARQ
jgi:bla regulator protein blaR1